MTFRASKSKPRGLFPFVLRCGSGRSLLGECQRRTNGVTLIGVNSISTTATMNARCIFASGTFWHQRQTGTPSQWKAYVDEMCEKRGYRSEICGYVGGRLTVHHMDYHDPSLNLWEYEEDEVQVVHIGACHRKADREREKEHEGRISNEEIRPEDRIYFPPNEEEMRKLAQYEPQFRQWLKVHDLEPTELWPLWYQWNVFGKGFLKSLEPPRQMKLS
jgi:hypothetical protein